MGIPTRAELDVMVQERIAEDPEFRGRLLADPRAAVAELVGMDLPDLVTVEVHEESLTHVHFVVPAQDATGELVDDDLELVAGGDMCWGHCGDVPPH